MTSDWVVTCAACLKAMPTLAEQYGPHDAPVCWACHTDPELPKVGDVRSEDRSIIEHELGRSIELDSDAEWKREEADRDEEKAQDVRRALAKRYGVKVDDLEPIETSIRYGERIDWSALPALKPQTPKIAKELAPMLPGLVAA